MNAGAIDSAIDAFIDGDMEFAQLRRTLELHVGRNPARRGPAKARLDGLLEAGTMSTALHRILVEELDRSVSEEVTIAADEEGDGPREPEAPAAFGAGPHQGELDEFLEPTLPDDRPELPPAPTAPADDAGADARPAGADAPEAPAVKLEPSAGEAPGAGPEFPSEPVAGGEEAAAPRPEGEAAGPETADTGDDLADRAEPAVAAGPGHMLAGRYVLESLLGRGGMSVVFRGRDLRIPEGEDGAQGVAVKLLTPEFARRADARAALAREAAFSRRLQHPAFVRIFDCDVTGPVPFLVMELLQGEQLRRLLVRRYPSPLPLAEAMTVIRGLAEALSHLHRAGVVHGDVKPGNVFLDPGGQVRLLDLGVAGSAEDSGASPMRARTPAYASPALLSGQPASAADDVYALGCVAYEVLAGHHPFGKLPGDEAAASDAVAERIETLSTARWQALQRSLQFDPARRQPDAGSFLAEFFPPPEPRRRTRPWAAGGILAGLLLGLALGWFLPPPEGVVSGARSLFERGRPLVGQTNPEERAGTGEARPEAV
ncbi:MAG: protein kinase, partial [Gammaproteobacteria bacterium]